VVVAGDEKTVGLRVVKPSGQHIANRSGEGKVFQAKIRLQQFGRRLQPEGIVAQVRIRTGLPSMAYQFTGFYA
jgi:hypothetical protein